MKRSSDRILTTHTGSLARPPELLRMLSGQSQGQKAPARFAGVLREAINDCVREQAECGIDIVSDGELGKPQFADYVADRLNGLEGQSDRAGSSIRPSARSRFRATPLGLPSNRLELGSPPPAAPCARDR